MRRFVTLVALLLFSLPFGIAISGCSHNVAPTFCNGSDSGITVGTATTITLLPKIYGVSLNYAEIGQISTPAATDCKGSGVNVGQYLFSTTDMTIADVQPQTGRLCGGTWNRNTGGGIPDYTTCIATNKSGTAYISVSADGVTSNPLPVFIHPVVTSVVLGGAPGNCTAGPTYDPTTSCCPLALNGTNAITATPYAGGSCLSQGATAQLYARVFSGTQGNQTNISCLAGHLSFSAQNPNIVTIDQNGVVTANQPGSSLIQANVSNAVSTAGLFATCPPAAITLSVPGVIGATNPVLVNQNNTQPFLATVTDTAGMPLTGLNLEYVSTAPDIIPAGGLGTVTPAFAGAASISAICQPGSCNPSSYNQIGLFGNGKPIVSNSLNFAAPGTNGTILYMASTQSQYLVPFDFTAAAQGAPYRLPYVPNSAAITQDGYTIYLGSSTELMVITTLNTVALTREDVSSPGTVLGVSPDGNMIVISDPTRQLITIQSAAGSAISTYGGAGTHVAFAPDNQTVYITAGNQLLVYSSFTGWNNITPATAAGTPVTDVAVAIPSVGAYVAGPVTTARSYCPSSTLNVASSTSTNVFYPQVDSVPTAITDRISATNDGLHMIGATVTPRATLNDLRVQVPIGACPTTGPGIGYFTSTLSSTILSPITATAITGVLPASDSSIAFITYTGTGGVLPAYSPVASGPGQTTYIKLSGTAVAPVAGVISADNTTVYTGTTGDNLVHIINRTTLTDSSTVAPKLLDPNGNPVAPNLLFIRTRRTT
jgi:hypothetical protein